MTDCVILGGMNDSDWRKSSHSFSNGNCAEVAAWRKPSASMGNECVEVGQDGTVVAVRDTKLREHSPVLAFPAAAWAEFTARVKT